MPFNGAGQFKRLFSWVADAANGINIRADRMDQEMDGFAQGLSKCITMDGQQTPSADLPMGGFKHTDAADGTAPGDYTTIRQLAVSAGASLVGFQQAGDGAVQRAVQDELRDRVSVKQFGADDSGATSTANVTAFTKAAATGRDVYVPKPETAYYLASDPTIPANINIIASPDWFTGPGKLPMHAFVALSEGVDPRVFSTKVMGYTETEPNEKKRKWGVVGWVNNKNAPAPGSEGTTTDAVGVDGRGRTAAPNGRVWGLLGLGQMDAGVSGVAQAVGSEIDINQNNAHNDSFDGLLPAKAQIIASGGDFRPETGTIYIATKTPTNGRGDNRFFAVLRFFIDCYKEFGLHFDDGCTGVALRVPSTAIGLRMTKGNNWNFDVGMLDTSKRGYLRIPTGAAIDVLRLDGSQAFEFSEGYTRSHVPIAKKTSVLQTPAAIDASAADIFVLTTAGTISGISNGTDGQEITLINVSGGTITIAAGHLVGGSYAMPNNGTVKLIFAYPTWFETARSPNA